MHYTVVVKTHKISVAITGARNIDGLGDVEKFAIQRGASVSSVITVISVLCNKSFNEIFYIPLHTKIFWLWSQVDLEQITTTFYILYVNWYILYIMIIIVLFGYCLNL